MVSLAGKIVIIIVFSLLSKYAEGINSQQNSTDMIKVLEQDGIVCCDHTYISLSSYCNVMKIF